jgi:hypothetical protein
MSAARFHAAVLGCIAAMLPADALRADIQGGTIPRVSVPTGMRSPDHRSPDFYQPYRPAAPASRVIYPWKKAITCTIFWVGEQPTARNPTPNCKSSWDTRWALNFGGYDNPDPAARIADHVRGEFRPRGFVPRLNTFYVALPYNDVINHRAHKPEAPRVIPWFSRMNPEPGDTVLKGRWIHIHRNGRNCFAQWEDCGPWTTDDWEYVFGNKPPKNVQNGGAGIDISPAVRDYLGIKSGQKVHWRFVEASQVPYGPWKKYGQDQPTAETANELAAQQRRLEHLRKLRDENFRRKPLDGMRN